MSQSLVFALLALALVLPILGAIALRVLAGRLSQPQLYGVAALVFGAAIASVLLLARANVSSIQVGELSLLLPAAAHIDEVPEPDIPLEPPPLPTSESPPAPSAPPTQAAPTEAPTVVSTAEPTAEVPTETPTVAPPTPEPTAEPPTAEPTAQTPRTYVVQAGDTLRSIAEQFNVSTQALIDANDLTPEQADSLRVGQELVIP